MKKASNIGNSLRSIENECLELWNEINVENYECDHKHKSFETVSKRIDMFDVGLKRRRTIKNLIRKTAIAASIFVIIGLSIYGFQFVNKQAFQNIFYKYANLENRTEYAPMGERHTIFLNDSTKVVLNSGSVLIFPKYFNDNKREVHLVGEAYFDVKSDMSRPFIVNTHNISVTALGTTFGVSAYPDDNSLYAILESGVIEVEANNNLCQTVILQPNEKVTYNNRGFYAVKKADAEGELSWIDDKLIFNNNSFKSMITRLQRQFGIIITYDQSKFEGVLVVAKFIKGESIEEIFEVLKEVLDFEYKPNANGYTIA